MRFPSPHGIVAGAGAIGVLAFAITLMLPPTDLKANWTNVRYATPVALSRPDMSEPDFTPAEPPPVAAAWQEPDAQTRETSDRFIDDDNRERQIADEDAAYGDGYAWAAERGLEDGRDCRRLRGARRDGCGDYVASLAPAGEEVEN